jgi:hypothetical protein
MSQRAHAAMTAPATQQDVTVVAGYVQTCETKAATDFSHARTLHPLTDFGKCMQTYKSDVTAQHVVGCAQTEVTTLHMSVLIVFQHSQSAEQQKKTWRHDTALCILNQPIPGQSSSAPPSPSPTPTSSK